MPKRTVYWDACAFIALINDEAGRVSACRQVWAEAERGETDIVTSFFTFAEVFKAKCEGTRKPLAETDDKPIESLLGQKWVHPVVLDREVGRLARRLMRRHSECKKPSDAIHLATAVRLNVDEMHTFDGSDLLDLTGKVSREDGVLLDICTPRVIPPPGPKLPDLFEGVMP